MTKTDKFLLTATDEESSSRDERFAYSYMRLGRWIGVGDRRERQEKNEGLRMFLRVHEEDKLSSEGAIPIHQHFTIAVCVALHLHAHSCPMDI
jgi:hypothetical protein